MNYCNKKYNNDGQLSAWDSSLCKRCTGPNDTVHFAFYSFRLLAGRRARIPFACSWEEARKSTVYIFVDGMDPVTGAKTAAQGTGFVISRLGYVLTASHLLRDWVKQRELDKAQNPIKASHRGQARLYVQQPARRSGRQSWQFRRRGRRSAEIASPRFG